MSKWKTMQNLQIKSLKNFMLLPEIDAVTCKLDEVGWFFKRPTYML